MATSGGFSSGHRGLSNNAYGYEMILVNNSPLRIVNSTVTGSTGIWNSANEHVLSVRGTTDVMILNSTFSNNPAIGNILDVTSGAGITVYNSIFSGNSGPNCSAATFTSSHSYSDDGTCNFAANDGADTATIMLDTLTTAANGTQYYPLLGGDPLNGGENSLLPNETDLGFDIDGDDIIDDPIDTDQRGFGYSRTHYWSVDAGAFEYAENVSDAMHILQILTGVPKTSFIDINNNDQADMGDVIGILQYVSEIR